MYILAELESIGNLIKSIDEDNFDSIFPDLLKRTITIRNQIQELESNGIFHQNIELKKKIDIASKEISKNYDNLLKMWKNKLDNIAEMLIISTNKRKILSYKR